MTSLFSYKKMNDSRFPENKIDSSININPESLGCPNLIQDKKRIWSIYSQESKKETLSYEGEESLKCQSRKNNKVHKIKQIIWTEEEETLLFNLHKMYGNKWSKISHKIPGKDKNTVKNCFYCKMRKIVRMLNSGIVNDRIRKEIHCTKQAIYLLEHIRNNYFESSDQKLDKYVKEMIISHNISKASIDKYIEFILRSVDQEIKQNVQLNDQLNSFMEEKLIKFNVDSNAKILSEHFPKNCNYSLPIPFNMFNPKFNQKSLEDINYKFLFNF